MENKLKNISVISSNKILKSEKFNDFYFNSKNPTNECKYVYIDANDLIKLIIPVLGGKGGGGRSTLAQGGGSSPENSEKAIKILMEEIERKLAS